MMPCDITSELSRAGGIEVADFAKRKKRPSEAVARAVYGVRLE